VSVAEDGGNVVENVKGEEKRQRTTQVLLVEGCSKSKTSKT
jgi:hypothetical protein